MTTTMLEVEHSAPPPAAEDRQRVVLTGITWDTYRRLRQECDRLHLKMTFDRGTLEIMAPRPDHAIITRFIDQIIVIVCEEMTIPLSGYRDTTWHKQALDRGLEADDCYYVQHASDVMKLFGLDTTEPVWGRIAVIFCNGEPAIDLLEIVTNV